MKDLKQVYEQKEKEKNDKRLWSPALSTEDPYHLIQHLPVWHAGKYLHKIPAGWLWFAGAGMVFIIIMVKILGIA